MTPNDGRDVTHPLHTLFDAVIRGVFPPADGTTNVLPRPAGAIGAILSFTAHHIVAADIDPAWVETRCPRYDLQAPLAPKFVLEMAARLGTQPSASRLVLCAPGSQGEPDLRLVRLDLDPVLPRVARAQRYRTDIRVYATPDRSGMLTLGRGLAGRWEAGFEVVPQSRGHGLGAALATASLYLVGPDQGVFMQVAIGNVASLRSVLRAGFSPIGSEILFQP